MNRTFRVILLWTVVVTCACRQQSLSSRAPDPMASAVAPTAAELSGFTQQSNIQLPSSAEVVRFYGESGLDSARWIQFRLPAAQLQQFIADSPIPSAEVRFGPAGSELALYYFRSWLPGTPRSFQYADTEIAPGRCVKCIFDFDNPQTTVVYLMWFTT